MDDAADMPTIEEILDSYGVSDYLDSEQYAQMLAELRHRDNVLRTDSLKYVIDKAMKKIVEQY